jgi:orotate phosphoribosyltransferase
MNEDLLSLVRGRSGHFLLESGHHGDVWFQLETPCLHSRAIRPFAVRLAERLKNYNVDSVCGPLVEGAFVALMVSLELAANSFMPSASQTPRARAYSRPSTVSPGRFSRQFKANASP